MITAFLVQSFNCLIAGFVLGLVFSFLRLPIPAPPVVPAVFGILGVTLGYMLFQIISSGTVNR